MQIQDLSMQGKKSTFAWVVKVRKCTIILHGPPTWIYHHMVSVEYYNWPVILIFSSTDLTLIYRQLRITSLRNKSWVGGI